MARSRKRKPVRDPKVRAVAASAAAVAGGAVAARKLVRARVERSRARELRRYRLQPGEPAGDGLRRIARGQIDLALELLGSVDGGELDKAIHGSRKAFKRLRALLRVARDTLGDDVYRRESEFFRDAGRALSGVRDAQVMVATLEDLTDRCREAVPAGGFDGLRDALGAEARAARERTRNDAAAVGDVIGALAAARARVDTWPLPDDVGLLAPGLKRIYRRGRRAQRAAAEEPSTEALHELRKRAKDLWHAGQLLRPAAPKPMRKLARRAHRLSDLLGEDHDLAVLLDGARARPHTLQPGELELLDGLVARRRAELQHDALARGGRLYRRKPRKVARHVSRPRG